MVREETQLVLGRGEVYFDRFAAGTRVGEGEVYIGNTPSFQIEREIERMRRVRSYRGRLHDAKGSVLSESHTINFMTDNIDMENVALWYGGGVEATEQPQQNLSENIVAKRGRFFQLGQPVGGYRNLGNISVKIGSRVIDPASNWAADGPSGRIQILPSAIDIADGQTIAVSYRVNRSRVTKVQSQASEIYGALRLIATNAYGPLTNFYFPMVRLSPRGAVDMKGDEFQQFGFAAAAMSLRPGVPQVVADRSRLFSPDENAIYDAGITLSEFMTLEDMFNTIINTNIPAAGY